ncbi:efflux RND transporter periplasmic adaptor subunit [Microbulbifer thermotolerans]|uniref:Efflux transporter periplasmic adaptor subunit n=1 Tax=Microbulbifer thermotolerans TaxID=252514 RepID=A0A143HPD8_MICTH|nr:efflux RND transporter periplasmic adaptor subunit [Microbulbifer thermotolerans]AMX03583.1 efflux transporter periplasmic adaptor subunit [Microbulbifer thermotolerans]MCX2778212.1 efflux RND transporter periplasmic adaptor subunit [Microbulbifer thermotolerans]MCX2804560.1 efflux RND transporter periplasmic adaptor subunit [Microbulbifer thermotolerans]MCX2831340.1 efflux RND transporter periplasmic adaptor subunit [Microbulbifer thermotolerans]
MKKKYFKATAPILVLALGYGVVQLMSAAKPAPEKKAENPRPISLVYNEAREEAVRLTVATQGEVRPHTEIDLTPQVSGRIIAISENFAEGAGFTPGETLVQLDDADYRLALARAEAGVAAAEVVLLQARATAAIKRQQWETANPGREPTPLQVNQPQVAEAEAQLRSAKAELADAQLNLARTQIKLPFRGRVIRRDIGVGQYVTAGTVLGRVFATDRVEVRLPLTDAQLQELDLPMGFVATERNPGPPVTLSAQVGRDAHQWQGRIVRTQAAVDQQTRLIYAVAEVADPYGAGASNGVPLAVGLFVSAEAQGVRERPALVLPREALRSADKVYVVDESNRLNIRTVEVLSTSKDRVVIASGLTDGERVVTSAIANAVDGMEVQPIAQLARK